MRKSEGQESQVKKGETGGRHVFLRHVSVFAFHCAGRGKRNLHLGGNKGVKVTEKEIGNSFLPFPDIGASISVLRSNFEQEQTLFKDLRH